MSVSFVQCSECAKPYHENALTCVLIHSSLFLRDELSIVIYMYYIFFFIYVLQVKCKAITGNETCADTEGTSDIEIENAF